MPRPPDALVSPQDTLHQARLWLRSRIEQGARCPCCNQYAKVYKRTINTGQARSLIALYLASDGDYETFLHIPTVLGRRSAEEAKLRYWGLVEEELVLREDGGRAGYWRLTLAGRDFVMHRSRVPRYAWIYNSRVVRMSEGDTISISDALGHKFDYAELMSG